MDSTKQKFWQLVEKEHRRLLAFCCRFSGSSDDGADLCQDVLVSARLRFDRLRDHRAFRGWIYRIAINAFKSRIRRPWYSRVMPLSDKLAADLPGENPTGRHRANRLLQIGFRAITPEDQALIMMFEVEGWSIAELAEMTDKNEGAIKMRLSRIRRRMRERIANKFSSDVQTKTVKPEISEDDLCVVTEPGKK